MPTPCNDSRRPLIVADSAIPFLKGRLEHLADIRYLPGADFSPQIVREADALIVRTRTRCDRALLEGSSVRAIATATIGTDHISLDDCRSLGIRVDNAPGCNAPAVAQWVFAAILAAGAPRRKKLGIIGLGHVGSIVAEWGRGLGFDILACDPPRAERGDNAELWLPIDELLSRADIVTLHVPFTTSAPHPTRMLLDASHLAMMRPGSMLLNASRGEIVDEQALTLRLSDGSLTAAIDTWTDEPQVSRSLLPLLSVATPHIAGYSLQGKQRATRMAVTAICRALSLPVPDLSDLEEPYTGFTPSESAITDSYDILADSEALKARPEDFEALRNNYIFRNEPSRLKAI